MDFKPIDLISIYAAILSTFVFTWNVLKSKPKVSIELSLGIKENDSGVYISIKNPSLHKIKITSISLCYPYKKASIKEKLELLLKYKQFRTKAGWIYTHLVFNNVNTELPVTIEPYDAHLIFLPDENIREMLTDAVETIFMAVAQDSLWLNNYSPIFKY